MVLFLQYTHDGITYNIKIGKNSKQNWQIIEEASPRDIWFHLAGDMPSCHVILQVPDGMAFKDVPRQVIKHCCVLCKSNTNKFKSVPNIPVNYTLIEHVTLGTVEGQVFITNEKTIVI